MKFNTPENSQNDIELQRCPHDEKNPYTMIRNDLIRDQSISPNCRWLLIYLLSNNEQVWTVKISQVAKHVKGFIGRDAVYRIVNEGIEAGYIQRFEYFEDNMKRYKYYISETPKFKKSLRCPEIQYPEPKYPENQGRKEETSKEKTSLRKNISKNPPLSSPPEKPVPKKSLPKESLRSEEEDIPIFSILEQTRLSPKDKLRLSRQYKEADVVRAVTIARGQKVKTSVMGLLINILENPDKWPDAVETQLETHQQRIAHEYNETLKGSTKLGREALKRPGAKVFEIHKASDIAKENDKTIPANSIKVFLNGIIHSLSLNSLDFEQDIKDAIAQLR